MAVEPGVRGVEWPLRAERERTVSVTEKKHEVSKLEETTGVFPLNSHWDSELLV